MKTTDKTKATDTKVTDTKVTDTKITNTKVTNTKATDSSCKIVQEMKLAPEICESRFDEIKKVPSRDGFGKGLVDLGKDNKDVVVLCGDLGESTRTSWFREEFPDRFVQVGIAEQNMISVAAGLALAGKVPFVSTYGVFCPGRCWDQIRISLAYSQNNVKFSGAHTGISVGPDGATHQALEDIAITRCIPKLVVLVGADSEQCKKATIAAAKYKGPVYMRFGREKVPVITTPDTPFEIGKAYVYREGKDVTVFACGVMVYEALKAASILEKESISVKVVNVCSVKPIDDKTITAAAKDTGCAVTAEEHQVLGGMGSAVAEVLAEKCPIPIEFVGVKDTFGESGSPDQLMEKYGLSVNSIIDAVKRVHKRKK